MKSLYIAWQYLRYNRSRSLVLVACVTLIAFLPLALEVVLNESERQLMDRARTTPLLLGARGSALDLVMNSLYFSDEAPEPVEFSAAEQLADSSLAASIPLYVRFQARGFPVVGTTFDYFDFRGLHLAEGEYFLMLGECVIGAKVAQSLGLEAGDSLVTSPETLFDLAGVYPLKMRVAGVLETANTADDLGVFVDINTAWVIEGLAHGHEDLAGVRDSSVILGRGQDSVTANAKLMQYREVTTENLDSFHFHGDTGRYPLTAAIAVPRDERAGAILRGRYVDGEQAGQIVEPVEVVDQLMDTIFRIRTVLDSIIAVVGLATLLALFLVFALSLRLRQREIDTVFRLGGSRATIVRLLAAEVGIIVLLGGILCGLLLLLVAHFDEAIVRQFFV